MNNYCQKVFYSSFTAEYDGKQYILYSQDQGHTYYNFMLMDCSCDFISENGPRISIWLKDNKGLEIQKIRNKINELRKLLVYIYSIPLRISDGLLVSDIIEVKEEGIRWPTSAISLEQQLKLNYIEHRIKKMNLQKDLFNECLELIVVATKFYHNSQFEEAFFYYFKLVEKISRKFYRIYHEKHGRAFKSSNKNELKKFLKQYAAANFCVELIDNKLNTYVDLLYKEMNNKILGQIYGKILFFSKKHNLSWDITIVEECIELRNSIAHGDYVEGSTISRSLSYIKEFAFDAISKFFFGKEYKQIGLDIQKRPPY